MPVADVFISYSQKTPEPAKALAEALTKRGYDVWWDTRLVAGDQFDDEIRAQLEEADVALVIWTAESVKSKYVRMEAGIAWAWDKLMPVRTAELPLNAIPGPFQRIHTDDVADIERIERALDARGVRPQQAGRRTPLSREEIVAQLGEVDAALPASVEAWLRKCQQEGFRVVAKRSLMIKATIPNFGEVNFGTLFPDGTVQTNYVSDSSERLGDASIAAAYLDGVASLIEGAAVRRDGKPWTWRVEVLGQLPKASLLLERSEEWIALMKAAKDRFIKAAAVSGLEQ
jgi:hypothetical protein